MIPAVLLLAALVMAPVIGGGFGELANGVLQILVLAAVAAYLLTGRREDRVWFRTPGLIAIGLLAAATIASLFFSECIYMSLKQVLLSLACLGAYFLAATLSRTSKWAALLACGLAAAALWICASDLRDFVVEKGGGAGFISALMHPSADDRRFGPFSNPNFFAGFLVMALPITLSLYTLTRRGVLALVFGLAFAIELISLATTGSKFGAMAAVAGLVVFAIFALLSRSLDRQRIARLAIMAVICIPLLVLFTGTLRTRVVSAKAGGEESHSTEFRIYTWKGTVKMMRSHPLLGTGPGTFEVAYPRYALAGFTTHAHQGYLQVGAESGVIALAGLLAALAAIGWTGTKAVWRKAGKPDTRAAESDSITWEDVIPSDGWQVLSAALVGAFAASLVRNLVDSDWTVIGIALPFWTIAGMMVGRSGGQAEWKPCKTGTAVLTALCAVGVIFSATFGMGDWYGSNAADAAAGGNWDAARSLYQQAEAVSPWNPTYHRELGKFPPYEEGIVELNKAISLSPYDAKNYYTRGLVADRSGQLDMAAESYKKALSLTPHHTQTMWGLAEVYRKLNRTPEREAMLRLLLAQENTKYETLKGVPEMVDTRFARAHAYFGEKHLAEKNYQLAASEFESAAARLESWRAYSKYIQIARYMGQLSAEEETDLQTLLRQSYYNLSQAYTALGDKARAEEAKKKGDAVLIKATEIPEG